MDTSFYFLEIILLFVYFVLPILGIIALVQLIRALSLYIRNNR